MTDKERIETLLTALETALDYASDLNKWRAKYRVGLGCADTALTEKQILEGLSHLQEFAKLERDRLNEEAKP